MPAPAEGIDPTLVLLAWLGSFGAGVAGLTWFLTNSFKKNRDTFWAGIDRLRLEIKALIDTHERKDDRRFDSIDNRLWDIQNRNSIKDGTRPPSRRPTPDNGDP